jgi:hypothetical protein
LTTISGHEGERGIRGNEENNVMKNSQFVLHLILLRWLNKKHKM